MLSMRASDLVVQTTAGAVYDFRFHPTGGGGSVISLEDVTEKRTAAAKIERLAHFDELTDLPNRAMVKEKLAALVLDPAAVGTFAVHLLDLDAFKQVNDTLGHPVGDALLAVVSRRIKGALRAGDFCARLAGDEFVVVHGTAGGADMAARLASRLIEIISRPYSIEGQDVVIGASIGIVASAAGASAEDLLKHADLALYRAKQTGKGTFCFFERAMIGEANDRRNLENDLRHALRAGEISIFFQPIIDVQKEAVVSCEALARWQHPTRGAVGPDTFIGLAEATGLIVDLGSLVLHKACRAAMTWPDAVTVSVNLSVAQFRKGVVVDQIKEALAWSGLPPARLEVEVTESLALDNLATTHDMIGQIRALGVRVALDDFGTGYSSLAYLQQIPFDKIKIDRSFVRAIAEDGMSRSLVRLMTSFARGLDKTLVVEGVETAEQAAILRDMGVLQDAGVPLRASPAGRRLRRFLPPASPAPVADMLRLRRVSLGSKAMGHRRCGRVRGHAQPFRTAGKAFIAHGSGIEGSWDGHQGFLRQGRDRHGRQPWHRTLHRARLRGGRRVRVDLRAGA